MKWICPRKEPGSSATRENAVSPTAQLLSRRESNIQGRSTSFHVLSHLTENKIFPLCISKSGSNEAQHFRKIAAHLEKPNYINSVLGVVGQPYNTTGINFFKTEPVISVVLKWTGSLQYFICLQRILLMAVGTLLSLFLPSLPLL